MSDKIQNIQKGREAKSSRRSFLRTGLILAGVAGANTVDLGGIKMGVQVLQSGLSVAVDMRATRIANAQGCVDDGRPEACVNTADKLTGKSRFGGFYFKDNNNDGKFNIGDEPVQGVRGRRIVVGIVAPKGHDDFPQLNPLSLRQNPDGAVIIDDVKAGRNSGERTIPADAWDVFEIPEDPSLNRGIGYSLRTGSDVLTLTAQPGSLIDKIYGKTLGRAYPDGRKCGDCNLEPQCVWTIVFGRALKDAVIDLRGGFPVKALRMEAGKRDLFTDYIYGWKNEADANEQIDYNYISTVLTPALRESDKVVQSEVTIPLRTVPYENYSR